MQKIQYFPLFFQFFLKKAVPDVLSPQKMFNEVTGLNLEEGETGDFVSQLQQFQKQREVEASAHSASEDYPFNFFFDKSCSDKTKKFIKKHPEKQADVDVDAI